VAGQPHPGDLPQGRVRLLGRGRVDARADPAALRAALERRGVVLGYLVLAALADQLLDRGHRVSVFSLLLLPVSGAPLRAPDLLVLPVLRPPWSGVSPSPQCPSPKSWYVRGGKAVRTRPARSPDQNPGRRSPLARMCPSVTGTERKSTQPSPRGQSKPIISHRPHQKGSLRERTAPDGRLMPTCLAWRHMSSLPCNHRDPDLYSPGGPAARPTVILNCRPACGTPPLAARAAGQRPPGWPPARR
jgi:hypothetical protein